LSNEIGADTVLKDLNKLDAFFSDESKWMKGVSYASMECRCLVLGARLVSRNDERREIALVKALHKTAGLNKRFADGPTLGRWNDAPERTFADIKKLIADTRARLSAAFSPST
jgi:hypothetical protein